MKQVFSLALVCLMLLSCNNSEESVNTDSITGDSAKSDTIIPVVNDTVAKVVDTIVPEPSYDAFFTVWFTTSYCGGARPNDEILAEHATERLLTNSQILLRNHFTGMDYIIKTGTDGKGQMKMIPGKYDVYFTKNINEELGTGFDSKCSTWLNQLQMTVKVDSTGKKNKILVHFECNPCDMEMKTRP